MDLDGGIFYLLKEILIKKLPKFNLIIDIQSKFRNSLILKRIPHENFYSTTFGGLFSTKN